MSLYNKISTILNRHYRNVSTDPLTRDPRSTRWKPL